TPSRPVDPRRRARPFAFLLVFVAYCTVGGSSPVWATCAPGQHDFYGTCVEQLSLFGQASWKETAHGAVLGNALGWHASGLAIDRSGKPNRIYVADTSNNRILGFKDARRVKPGDRADIVIGQGDDEASGAHVPDSRFYRTSANYGSATATQTNDTGLSRPTALAIDSDGNLWVADFGNSRVVRFPAPFTQPDLTIPPKANLVIGQSTFTGNKIIDASQRTLSGPHGIAFTKDGHLLVSDVLHNRVLLFKKPSGADFTNGMLATSVIGQPDFVTAGPSIDNNRFFWPRGISTDTSDRLYVADSGSSRVLIFESSGNVGPDPRAAQIITNGLRRPVGIWVSPYTGEFWVADAGLNSDGSDGRAVRYPEYLTVSQNGGQINFSLASFRPIGVTSDRTDRSGNILLTEAIHRVSIYFPLVNATNAANYLTPSVRPISPGQYVSLFSPTGSTLALTDGSLTVFSTVPMPTTLADTQVLVNDHPVPIYFVGPRQINFLAPMGLPSSGSASIQVMRVSTGDILAVLDSAPLGVVAPGLFTSDSSGSGQAAALNEDNTINGPTNPISRGKIIQLYATGQGFVPGAPPDGGVPGKATPAQTTLNVFFNGVPATDVQYTGLAPSLIGTWQINVRIPTTVAPSNSVPVVIVANGVSSYDGSSGTPVPPRPTIAVKQ
ncbi:MAG: hypothetical protein ABI693_08655, partial [Bryobacteraceae bacterium]